MQTVMNATTYQQTNLQQLRMFVATHYVEMSEALVRQRTLEHIKENPDNKWIPTYTRFSNQFHSLFVRGMTYNASLVKLMNMFYEVNEYVLYGNDVFGILNFFGTVGNGKVKFFYVKHYPSYDGVVLFGASARSSVIEGWVLENVTFSEQVDLLKVTYR